MDLREKIRVIEDFPKQGISFKDITTLLKDRHALRQAIELMTDEVKDVDVDLIVSPESRGFIVGVPVATALSAGFIPVRKPGKLPAATVKGEYELEYGTDTLEMHADAVGKGQKVLLVDDLLATGGTIKAVHDMVADLGGELVGALFLCELTFLNGRDVLGDLPVWSVIKY